MENNALLFIRQLISGHKIAIECNITFGKLDLAEAVLDYLDSAIKINPTAPYADDLLKWITEKTEQIDNIKGEVDESDRVNRNVEASEGMER